MRNGIPEDPPSAVPVGRRQPRFSIVLSRARNPSRPIVCTRRSVVICESSNSTRASERSRLTAARLTPRSLSKAAVIEACQPLHTIPWTSMTAVLGAAATMLATSASSSVLSTSAMIARHIVDFVGTGHIPART